jgi:hypothetical protein
VHTFSGNLRQALITDRGEELRRALEADGVRGEARRGGHGGRVQPAVDAVVLKDETRVMLEVTGM